MNLNRIEFFNSPDGAVMLQELDTPVRELRDTDRHIIEEVIIIIMDMFPEAYEHLSNLYYSSKPNKFFFEYKIVHRFLRCNFGEWDLFHHDIDSCGNIHFEEVKCPIRSECLYNGIICKPKLNTNLTDRELGVLSLIGIGCQSPSIADTLTISVSTVNRHRENIKSKLKLKTLGELVAYYNTYIKRV